MSLSSISTTKEATDNEPQQKGKVCFICGSYTIFVRNIREPKHGPNMIDVITEKFNIRPLNDEKYLCYSCHNWLIDWHKNRKQNGDDHGAEDVPSATTSTRIAIVADTSGIKHRDDSSLEMLNATDQENRENIDVNNIIDTIRNSLKKYIYRRQQSDDDDLNDLVMAERSKEFDRNDDEAIVVRNPTIAYKRKRILCQMCHRRLLIKSNRSAIRFCRTCRFSIRQGHMKTKRMQALLCQRHPRTKQTDRSKESDKIHNRTMTIIHPTDIIEKLNRLGTSIYYENDCKYCTGNERAAYTPANAHEIDTIYKAREMIGVRHPTTESNEILITFDKAVTEVFSIESLYDSETDRNKQEHMASSIDTFHSSNTKIIRPDIQDILKNVPKSITITIT